MGGFNTQSGLSGGVAATLAQVLGAGTSAKVGQAFIVTEDANAGIWAVSETNQGGQEIPNTSPQLYANPLGGGGMFIPVSVGAVEFTTVTAGAGVDFEVFNVNGSGLLELVSAQTNGDPRIDIYRDGVKVVDNEASITGTNSAAGVSVGNADFAGQPIPFSESIRLVARNESATQRQIRYKISMG